MISTAKPYGLNYMPQLDGIRAFAIIFVIIAHWFAPLPSSGYISYGELGVTMFFVLSGFLITKILLKYKRGLEQHHKPAGFYLKNFFARRVLRIFPIYYLTIALILIFSPAIFGGDAWWHAVYLSNFYFVLVKHGWQPEVSQWWSLSVEEQFYLIWPFVILFVNRKYLTACITVMIVIAPVFRYFGTLHSYLPKYLTPSCLDALGLGALMALHYEDIETFLSKGKRAYLFILLSAMVMIFFTRYTFWFSNATDRLFLGIFSFFLIYKASKGFSGVISTLLSNPIVVYIGKISYGLYLYHKLLPLWQFNNVPVAVLQLLRIAVLLAIASLSYFLIERPILRLKRAV